MPEVPPSDRDMEPGQSTDETFTPSLKPRLRTEKASAPAIGSRLDPVAAGDGNVALDGTSTPTGATEQFASGSGDRVLGEPTSQPDWPTGGPAAATLVPPPEVESVTTTGVPHYPPPATPPGTAFDPGIGPQAAPGPDTTGVAEAKRTIARPLGRGLREVAETILLALLIFLLVRSVVQNFQVEGRSMEPTLQTGLYLLVNKALYWEINLETLDKFLPFIDPGDDPTRYIFRGPKRGDVIVFKAPNQPRGQPERDFIKRIIGLPGETVEVRDCNVFINGEPLDEPYILEQATGSWGPEVVPKDHLFVLGDNRNNSSDSRGTVGMLPKENIIGQAFLTYWPFSGLGFVDNTSVEPGVGSLESDLVDGNPTATCP